MKKISPLVIACIVISSCSDSSEPRAPELKTVISLNDDQALADFMNTADLQRATSDWQSLVSAADMNHILKDVKSQGHILYSIPLQSEFAESDILVTNLLISLQSGEYYPFISQVLISGEEMIAVEIYSLDQEVVYSSFERPVAREESVECYEVTIDFPQSITSGPIEGYDADAVTITTTYSQTYTVCNLSTGSIDGFSTYTKEGGNDDGGAHIGLLSTDICEGGGIRDEEGACDCGPNQTQNEFGICTCLYGEDLSGGCLNEADAWEETNLCIRENFENNECLMEVWNAIKTTDAGHELLSGFLKDNPEAKICFDFQDIGTTANGNAGYPGSDGIINVTINSNPESMGRSQLENARTMLHEMIHAELIRMVVEANGYDHLEQFANSYTGDDPFMMIWAYFDTYDVYDPDSGNTGWQHEYMADYYIEFIANGLNELHPFLSSQGFINYKTGSSLPGTTEVWNWDDFFIALAWQGLYETDQYQESVVNANLKNVYDWYVQEARAESGTNKCK